ncbi:MULTISPECIES: hypothetical protein [unclassified Pseudomonas]|uniref:hypothetical protein n=1 Tax=unclassified Pseudomonas TaxID=196821 RepID=UPI00244C288D|nr:MULTISPECIES: hypothetical protein [unclassified Pseudomonas]MDG9925641.1 hypothetical protein [Pseudomonas sp. GD04045]MDH0037242.1 hypothetical protein [Pseudomonas sp. GD04019]
MKLIFAAFLAMISQFVYAGYDLHITKKDFWADENGPCISREEWSNYVKTDRQVQRDNENSTDDFLVSLELEQFPVWYNPDLCEIYTKAPSKNAINKLIKISEALGARVQGDDGESYPLTP